MLPLLSASRTIVGFALHVRQMIGNLERISCMEKRYMHDSADGPTLHL